MTTGRSGARHALANSGSIVSIAAMRLASFRASSIWFPLDMISTPQIPFQDIGSSLETQTPGLGESSALHGSGLVFECSEAMYGNSRAAPPAHGDAVFAGIDFQHVIGRGSDW